MSLKTYAITICLVSGLLIAGCHPRVSDAEETKSPGSVANVDAGTLANEKGNEHQIGLRVIPDTEFQVPETPVTTPVKVMHIWFFPMQSRDGLSVREGFWIHRVYQQFSWGIMDNMVQQSVPLTQATNNVGTGALGGQNEDLKMIEPQPGFVRAIRTFNSKGAAQAPWVLQPPKPAQTPKTTQGK